MTRMMSFLLALVILGLSVAGASAVPDSLDSRQSEGKRYRVLEERLANLESVVKKIKITSPASRNDLPSSDAWSEREMVQRVSEIEKRLDETSVRLDETGQDLSNIQQDVLNLMTSTNTANVDTNAPNASLSNMVSAYVNRSLDHLGVKQFGSNQGCQSGRVGSSWTSGIEDTWPKFYPIIFDPPFEQVPQFTYGLAMLSASNARLAVRLESLGKTNATIKIGTWVKSLYGAKVAWMACP